MTWNQQGISIRPHDVSHGPRRCWRARRDRQAGVRYRLAVGNLTTALQNGALKYRHLVEIERNRAKVDGLPASIVLHCRHNGSQRRLLGLVSFDVNSHRVRCHGVRSDNILVDLAHVFEAKN
jgi:hypothetical protein